MRNLVNLLSLCALSLDPGLEKCLGEYAALGQVLIVCLKCIKSLIKACGKVLKFCLLLVSEVVKVVVIGTQPFASGSILFITPSRPAIRIAA